LSIAWAWMLTVWSRPCVEAICLDLQNHHGQCVPLLLWRLWASETGHIVSANTVAVAASTARRWQMIAVDPLRAARIALAEAPSAIDETERLALRSQVRGSELAAERLLVDALESLITEAGSSTEPLLDALMTLSASWGRTAPSDRIAQLIRAIVPPVD
jgi:uncharacterized protein (TIGR02444 family)